MDSSVACYRALQPVHSWVTSLLSNLVLPYQYQILTYSVICYFYQADTKRGVVTISAHLGVWTWPRPGIVCQWRQTKRCQATGFVGWKAIDICLGSVTSTWADANDEASVGGGGGTRKQDFFYDQVFGNQAVVCLTPANATEWNKLGYSTHVHHCWYKA